MMRSFRAIVSWWFATMTPQHAPMTTLAEREHLRKIRLLSVWLLITLLLALIPTLIGMMALASGQQLGWVMVCLTLAALWLNQRGHLQLAGLMYFFSTGFAVLAGTHLQSLSDPPVLLWECPLTGLLLVIAGVFLRGRIVLLMALGENLVIFWYLVVERHAQIIHLLSVPEQQSFFIYIGLFINVSALMGGFYAATTRRAMIQADRAVELEQAHHALGQAYMNLEAANETIQKQALTDGLTDLPNHRAVMDQLEKELERARRSQHPFSVLFFDADLFKRVNDTHGHAAGDAVLRQIGERAGRALRNGDILGRFGGEEFVILLPETDAGEAQMVAERIRIAIATDVMNMLDVAQGLMTTVSIGVATYPGDGRVEQELLQQADQAMYLAKRLGRNQVRTALEVRQINAEQTSLVEEQKQVIL